MTTTSSESTAFPYVAPYAVAEQVAETGRQLKAGVERSAPLNWLRSCAYTVSDVCNYAWTYGMEFLQRHPQVYTFARLWMLFAAIPIMIWIGANVVAAVVTLGVAGVMLSAINAMFILATTSVLGFTLFFTTATAGITYAVVFTFGLASNVTRRTYRYLSGTLDEVMGRQK